MQQDDSRGNPRRDDLDSQSLAFLEQMKEQELLKQKRFEGIRTVLVVLSSKGMVYDVSALRHEIRLAYPDATVFFRTILGKPVGAASPAHIDLLIDLTGPGQRQGLFYALTLRRAARNSVGRNAGLFRKGSYSRIFNEKSDEAAARIQDVLERERYVQKHVLALAGVGFVPTGETHPDRGKTIALTLPPMQRL